MPDFNQHKRRGLEDMNSGSKELTFSERTDLVFSEQDHREQIKKAEKKKAPARFVEYKCHVCTHPYRDFIETMLVRGHTYKGISDRISPPVDRRSISHHYKNHMDLQDAALRSILESEAQIQGLNHEEGVADVISKRAVLEVMLRKGYEDITMGVTTVEPRDLVQIAKLLGDMDSHAYEVGLDELRAQVQLFIQAIKDVCDRDTQGDIAARIKVLRGREGVTKEIEKAMSPVEVEVIPADIPEAEVVEVS